MRLLIPFIILFNCSMLFGQEPYYGGNSGEKLDYLFYYLDKYYIDKTNNDSLATLAIKRIVESLDPFSEYKSKEESEAQLNRDNGKSNHQSGFNLYKSNNQTYYINYVHENGPAERAGLETGMLLRSINGINIESISNPKLVLDELKDSFSITTLDIAGYTKTFKLKKEQLKNASILSAFMVDKTVGYIQLSHFNNQTADDFKATMLKLKAEGMTELILDLRNNNGGVKNAALALANEFLSGEKNILTEEGANFEKQIHQTTNEGYFKDGKISILTNAYTASASEILTAALQDWDRALIIGQATYGKGLIQQSYKLNDGSSIRLTIAEYKSPAGRTLQRRGKALNLDKYLQTEGIIDTVNLPSGFIFKSMNGRTLVKGNGGIYPDYILNGTRKKSAILRELNQMGYIYDFAFNYFLQQNGLKHFDSWQALSQDDDLNILLIHSFKTYINSKDYRPAKDPNFGFPGDVIHEVRAWLSSLRFGSMAYYNELAKNDDWVIKAQQLINQKDFNQRLQP